jgi:hypothetical protein
MFLIETKDLRDCTKVGHSLNITPHQATVQYADDDYVTLTEHLIPVFHHATSTVPLEEVSIKVDEFILQCINQYSSMSVFDNGIVTFGTGSGEVTYRYTEGSIIEMVTRLPPLMCCFETRDLPLTEVETVILTTTSKKLNIGKVFHLPTVYVFDEMKEPVQFQTKYVLDAIRGDGCGGLCKMYLEPEFPVCFETVKASGVKKRVFIAPL